jgi:hypothetical protein
VVLALPRARDDEVEKSERHQLHVENLALRGRDANLAAENVQVLWISLRVDGHFNHTVESALYKDVSRARLPTIHQAEGDPQTKVLTETQVDPIIPLRSEPIPHSPRAIAADEAVK